MHALNLKIRFAQILCSALLAAVIFFTWDVWVSSGPLLAILFLAAGAVVILALYFCLVMLLVRREVNKAIRSFSESSYWETWPDRISQTKACLIAGAVGDALGAPVEFMSLEQIHAKYGPSGITRYDQAYGRIGAITDDTQMTLWTIDGLIRAHLAGLKGEEAEFQIGLAYQRWLATQGETALPEAVSEDQKGWLFELQELHSQRAPGNTCLASLRVWKFNRPENDSKGCGTVMRSAPFGLHPSGPNMAGNTAGFTHGHWDAYESAYLFAEIIDKVISSIPLKEAAQIAWESTSGQEQTRNKVGLALELAESDLNPTEAIRQLGQGWVAEEALAIGLYCALKAEDNLLKGLIMAVNHDGDTDSTGSICGNLIGAAYGWECVRALPPEFLRDLELREDILVVAEDLVNVQRLSKWQSGEEPENSKTWEDLKRRYPAKPISNTVKDSSG
jgi:ADP-ribosylglycohydrolase